MKNTMIYTKYQTDIFEAISRRSSGAEEGNIIVQAAPGGSKTTSIIKSCDYIATDYQRTILLSFNKHIADRLATLVPAGVESSTINAFGWRICVKNVKGRINLTKWKDINILNSLIGDDKQLFNKIKWPINQMVSLCKAYMVTDNIVANMRKISDIQGIDIPNNMDVSKNGFGSFDDIFKQCYLASMNETKIMSFDDQVFMPLIQGWTIPQYSFVMVDESQDLSLLNMEIIKAMSNNDNNGTCIFVGDENQACYAFRGAQPDSMDIIREMFDCKKMPLSVCFRCPEKVIEEAQKIYPDGIESPTKFGMENVNGEGLVETVSKEEFRKLVDIGDFVLCRTTAPLVKECLRMLPYKACFVKGREIGEGLLRIVDIVCDSDYCKIGDFARKLEEYSREQIGRLNSLNKEYEACMLEDQVESLNSLMLLCDNTDQLIEIIKRVAPGDIDNCNKITFMTLHRSKGDETSNVFILRRDLIPHPKAKILRQEMNLLFIGITRAQRSLRYVEKENGER